MPARSASTIGGGDATPLDFRKDGARRHDGAAAGDLSALLTILDGLPAELPGGLEWLGV